MVRPLLNRYCLLLLGLLATPLLLAQVPASAQEAAPVPEYDPTQALFSLLQAPELAPAREALALSVGQPSPLGAMGNNEAFEIGQQANWDLAAQALGTHKLAHGLAMGDTPQAEQGLTSLAWALAQQRPDGNFMGAANIQAKAPIFLEAMTYGMAMMQAEGSPSYRVFLLPWTRRIEASARWMNRPDNLASLPTEVEPYSHRAWARASFLLWTGHLTRNETFARLGQEAGNALLTTIAEDGTLPEAGGFDPNYQARSLLAAARYALCLKDENQRAGTLNLLAPAFARLAQAVDPDGHVTLPEGTLSISQPPAGIDAGSVDAPRIALALSMGAELLGESSWQEAAERLLAAGS